MATCKCVIYYRANTARQGPLELELEAQRTVIADYLHGGTWKLVGEFTEIETGKSVDALASRPELHEALEICKKKGATLIIANLGRLSRSVNFVNGLVESGVDFKAADIPHADRFMIHMHAVMAEWERERSSTRMKAALAVAKARGVVLGATGPTNLRANIEARQKAADAFAKSVENIFTGFTAAGLTQRAMAEELNRLGIACARGGQWKVSQVGAVLKRLQCKPARR
jgi:DNA invertase Pin-like site-specific DNA recombinase